MPTLDSLSTIVSAREFRVRADISDVFVHVGQLDRYTAAEEALDYPILAYLIAMPGQIPSNYPPAPIGTIRALNLRERTFLQMSAHPTPPHDHLTQVVRTLGG